MIPHKKTHFLVDTIRCFYFLQYDIFENYPDAVPPSCQSMLSGSVYTVCFIDNLAIIKKHSCPESGSWQDLTQ